MTIERFLIFFNEPFATYVKGQQVTGNVVIVLQKEKKCRAIELKLTGKAKVHWTEGMGDDSESYSASEVYLQDSIYLAGGPNTDITIPPGEHRYPFKLIVPAHKRLPSSFEGTSGRVRYTVKAAICRPWKFDHKCKAAFTVLNPLDLNSEPSLLEPVHITTEKKLCCGCWSSSINLAATLPFVGFVPGQNSRAVFELDNATRNAIVLKARIVQVVTYLAQGSKKKVQNSVVEEKIGNVSPGGSMTSSVVLTIPPLPNSYLRDCDCIDISYIYEIRGSVSGPHRDVVVGIPIVIGSIPFTTQFASIAPWDSQLPSAPVEDKHSNVPHYADSDAQGSTSSKSTSNPFIRYSEMPPPTYEEYIAGGRNIGNEEDNADVRGVKDFAPRYPVYRFTESYA